MLQSLSEVPGGIILLLADDKDSKSKKPTSSEVEKLRQSIPQEKFARIKLNDKKNLASIKKDIQHAISEKIDNNNNSKYQTFVKCAQHASNEGIKIDEESKDSKVGFKNAEKILKEIQKGKDPVKLKQIMLPLQGPDLWHAWAAHDKELHRHNDIQKTDMDMTSYNADINGKKQSIHQKQLRKPLTPVMSTFIEVLLKNTLSVKKYFLHWLKLLLDDHSRKILPKLHNDYQKIRDQLLSMKQKGEKTAQK